jgi:hypothetical protein
VCQRRRGLHDTPSRGGAQRPERSQPITRCCLKPEQARKIADTRPIGRDAGIDDVLYHADPPLLVRELHVVRPGTMGAIKRPSRPRTVLLGALASISSYWATPPISVSLPGILSRPLLGD